MTTVIPWMLAACGASPETPSATPPAPAERPAKVVPPEAPGDRAAEAGPELVGLCDASGAARIGTWLVVADDERNVLRTFDWSGPTPTAAPGPPIDLTVLSEKFGKKEADLEGIAVTADGLVWFTGSHDTGKDTERKESRQRVFALKIDPASGTPVATLAAGPSADLIEKGQNHTQLQGIVENTVGKTSKDPGGLSIEGLAAGPAGSLLFGFRTPIHASKAMIQRLDNPGPFAGGAEPELTGPRWLDLKGRGIRSLEAEGEPGSGSFLIVAGPAGDGGSDFALYRWRGFDDGTAPERLPVTFGDLKPEALFAASGAWWVLSDDGTRKVGGTECKDLEEGARKTRSAKLAL
ncbi:MAG: DUF3616 domain-containing protein [Myxococcota bacterium]